MKQKNSRRDFLKIASLAPVGSLILIGCGRAAPADDPINIDTGSTRPSKDMGTTPKTDVSVSSDTNIDTNDVAHNDASSDAEVGVDVAGDHCEATGSDVEGPFHVEGAPNRTTLADPDEEGTRLVIEGTVVDENCVPIAGAMLDVWHADDNGDYHDGAEYRLRGQMMTDALGRYRFETIKPGRYPLGNSTRPAHIHFIVSKPGFVPLTTQLYFEGDPFLNPNDPCGNGCNSGDETLIVPLSSEIGGETGTFQIVLQR